MNINGVANRKVSVTTEMGKCLYIQTERGQKNWGKNGTKHQHGRTRENGRFHFPRERTGDGSLKREPPARNGRLDRSGFCAFR